MEENKVEDKTEKTFKERYLAGEIEFEEIDRYGCLSGVKCR